MEREMQTTGMTSRPVLGVLAAATAAVAVAAGFAAVNADQAHAVATLKITKARYDSAGKDTGSNTSLNDEWVEIQNISKATKDLTGWTLRDKAGHVYTFPQRTLAVGKTVKVRTGSGKNSTSYAYWGKNWYVWNNTGDTATLRNATGKTIDTCSWGDGSGTKTC
jgi:hypothetical protein